MIENLAQLWKRCDKPKYWYYNVNQEQTWNETTALPAVQDLQQLALIRQYEQQMLLLAAGEDTVLFRHQPDERFLSYLSSEGIRLPTIKIMEENDWASVLNDSRNKARLIPYIVTEELAESLQPFRHIDMVGSDAALVKRINNKFLTRKLAINHDFQVTSGVFCSNPQELASAYQSLKKQGFDQCVLKIPYGSSGKGLQVIPDQTTYNLLFKFITRRHRTFDLLLEGWHPVKQHINCQLWIDDQSSRILAITEQHIDANGVYMGTNFTPEHHTQTLQTYRQEMTRLAHLLQQQGYRGICGVDSIIGKDGILYPIIEINARLTQVTYLLPQVSKLAEKFRYIISRFIRLETKELQDFQTMYRHLHEQLQPDDANRFMIYTFARHAVPDPGKTLYRIFILCYGNDQGKVLTMVRRFLACQKG